MTLLGKVFTFIVLILSVVFFVVAGFVNARHINYRTLVEDKQTGLNVQLSREQAKTRELTNLVQQLRDTLAVEQLGRTTTVSALETEMRLINETLKKKEEELAGKQSQLTVMAATELAMTEELKARTAENDELRQLLNNAREDRNAQYQKFVQSYDQYVRLQGEKQSLEKQSKNLARDFTAAKQQLDILGITPETKLDGPPAVNGVVNAVDNNLVEVSIGLDDGVRVGDQLDVYRGGAYVGRLQITRSKEDKAIGEILPEHSRGFIVKGDRVDSKLNEIYVKRPAQ